MSLNNGHSGQKSDFFLLHRMFLTTFQIKQL